ncbi:hypothetical protein TgHK011_004811 [Trichoderma gracile]|nr:hypothetical protein TgHK011_004811 [Trichoderma gracile]
MDLQSSLHTLFNLYARHAAAPTPFLSFLKTDSHSYSSYVPSQPNSPPDNVFTPAQPARDLDGRSWLRFQPCLAFLCEHVDSSIQSGAYSALDDGTHDVALGKNHDYSSDTHDGALPSVHKARSTTKIVVTEPGFIVSDRELAMLPLHKQHSLRRI